MAERYADDRELALRRARNWLNSVAGLAAASVDYNSIRGALSAVSQSNPRNFSQLLGSENPSGGEHDEEIAAESAAQSVDRGYDVTD